jgi:uncharacterized protein YuzB (UPF0349 family)
MDSPDQAKQSVRFCVNNPPTLSERNELIARGFDCRDCLGNCSDCFEGRFLEIDDEFVEGESYDEILSKKQADPSIDPDA